MGREAGTTRLLSDVGPHSSGVTGMDLSADGRLLDVAAGAVVEIWDVQQGIQVTTLKGHVTP